MNEGHTAGRRALLAAESRAHRFADPGVLEPVWFPVPAPQTGLVSLLKRTRSSPTDIFHLYSALLLGPHSTPGQLSNLEVELHLSVNDEAGEVVVMRRRAGGSTSWDSYCSHM